MPCSSPECAMCSKTAQEVEFMIAGATGFICDACIDCCGALIAEIRATKRIMASLTREGLAHIVTPAKVNTPQVGGRP